MYACVDVWMCVCVKLAKVSDNKRNNRRMYIHIALIHAAKHLHGTLCDECLDARTVATETGLVHIGIRHCTKEREKKR